MNFSFIPVALAATPLLDPSVSYTSTDIIRIGIALVVLVAIVCAIVFIIWGWLMLILSGGKNDKVSSALWSIRYSIIGVIVIVLALFIIPPAGELLGLGNFEYISPKNIFDTLQVLMSRVFGA